jgi:CRISPR-associated endonuclease/helicase Cas3
MTLTVADFAAYFEAVHCHPPFPWQQRLAEQLARDNQWPDVLDLPTGAGKTAALDAAVFHLALQADAPQRAALRIALVVDRRLVVDDAHRRALKIACALGDPSRFVQPGRAVVEEMARRLQRLAGEGEDPLVAVRLRGGAPLEHDWARTPTQPTILCSTVDQVGSRLLFRGYGVTDRMKPVHAGLLGEDSLILLDEAHLSEPFQHTLQAVRDIGNATVATVVLTATPGRDYQRSFGLEREDREHQILRTRISATKPVRLMKPIASLDPAGAFTRIAREIAERLRRGGVALPAVGVVVNRIDLARAIFSRLQETEDAPFECALLIGRSRDVARRKVEGKLAPFRTGAEGRDQAKALMVVATQCLEVGVDLDLDGLVTQAASLDALRQRFGRLNRAGRCIPAAGAVLVTSESLSKADDPVYGDRIRETWNTLTKIARENCVDFGVTALDKRLRRAPIDVAALGAPRARAPVVMPAYLDLWSHTAPVPAADPEVGLFLHGAKRSPAEVSLVWRSDITTADLADERAAGKMKRILELVRPCSAEMLVVPIWAAKGWLRRWNTARAARVADVPEGTDDLDVEQSQTDRKAFRWAGDDPRTGLVSAGDMQPGDVLVVPAEYGGCDKYGWAPQALDPVADVADVAAWPYRGRRLAVRVTPDVRHWPRLSDALPAPDEDLELDELLAALPAADEDAPGHDRRDVRCALEALRDTRGGARRIEVYRPYGATNRGAVLVAGRGIASAGDRPGAQPATEDESLSHTAGKAVTLDAHTDSVVTYVDRFTSTLRLDRRFGKRIGARLAADLCLASTLHDIGKADPRFQLFLSGADWWNRPDGKPLAKSGRRTVHRSWERAELPKGWRHEAQSVRMAVQHPRFSDAYDPFLVLWLIGTHHGFGRPFYAFSDPRDGVGGPQSLAYDFGGLDWFSIFDQLRQHYGIWRLAWLEAILRLADHRASEAADGTSS